MAKTSPLELRKPFFGKISADLIAAKNSLRDQLTGEVEKAVPQALVYRMGSPIKRHLCFG